MPSSLEPVTLYPIFTRVCLRCRRPVNGYGFYTLYGYILVEQDDGSLKKVHGCGSAVHDQCPLHNKTREVSHNADEFWGETPPRRNKRRARYSPEKSVEKYIFLKHNGRYGVRIKKRRLGTYKTIRQARVARDKFLKSQSSNERKEHSANAE